jgi:hypothetical protein
MTEEVTLQTSTGAVEELTGNAAPPTADTAGGVASSGELPDGAENMELLQHTTTDPHRLLECGVALHGVSADEDDNTDEDNPREMTEEEEATAKAVLDDPSYDQEGLALTGGDLFSTIKKAALESKLTEKELAASSVADPGCLSRIPDPDFYPSRIPDLGSKNSNKRER